MHQSTGANTHKNLSNEVSMTLFNFFPITKNCQIKLKCIGTMFKWLHTSVIDGASVHEEKKSYVFTNCDLKSVQI